MNAMELFTGRAPLATPFEINPFIERDFKQRGHYITDYNCFLVDVMGPVADSRKIAAWNAAEWSLVPNDFAPTFVESPENLRLIQGIAFPYKVRHPITEPPAQAFVQNLRVSWQPVSSFGPYTLYRRRHGQSENNETH